ncbi:MAG TPA: DegT/DnrJ/EryC1/StrS family aminotransferase, partial [Chitinophagales bacterium]|nr:DegT/DnrJ/EryC1/StrS family aminotransferase [Chitinophagales bacterium]
KESLSRYAKPTDKYNWVDIGSSYLMSDINAAYLYAQLEEIENIQTKRLKIWNQYYENLKSIKDKIGLPYVPDYATNNAHLFYMVCQSKTERDDLIEHLRSKNIYAVFHYQNLHQSPFFSSQYHGKELPNAQVYNDCLLRLPLFFDLSETDLDYISKAVISFFK